MPLLIKKARARERPRPIQPAFHSQSLRRSEEAREGLSAVGPSPMNRAMMKMTMAGATSDTMTSVPVESFSFDT